ncbi:hypothetical protein ACQCN2_12935 [Brevibacillus ginsengisoli]|uniref:hypothetical protein n=1 Tax=Brevibacillus ginsengisoli TaxID=363854 RepID=UPI003CE9E384
MEKADWLTISLCVNIVVFLGGLYFIARKREARLALLARQSLERQLIPLCDQDGFEQPIWQGRIHTIIAEDERHETQMDVIVYPTSLFIGFIDDGFPFLTLPAEQIIRVVGEKGCVSVLYRREDGRTIRYQLQGQQLRGITEKIEFIRKRAQAR